MLVSVAMTSYNHAQYVLDALKSVVIQTYQNWELIIVDDYSTDNSLEVIQKYVKKNKIQKKVTIISHEKNKGYGSSLKEAIEKSSGELVVTLDSDDALANSDVLFVCVKVHKKHSNASMTYSNYLVCNENLKLKSFVETRQIRDDESYLKRGGAFTENAQPGDELNVSLKISHLKAFKRKYYDMTEGIDPKLKKTIDKDLVFKLEEVGKLIHINEFLMLYRRHSNSLAAQFGRANKESQAIIEKARKGIYSNALKRRGLEKDKLQIFIDGSQRPAVSRMFSYWRKMGHEIVTDPEQANVQLSVVRISAKTNLPILLRIDGIYYDKAEDFVRKNIPISESHEEADAIVYQSNLSKLMCEKYLNKRRTSFHDVIHNGISELNWSKLRKSHEEINIISCAKWRRHKRLPEIIEIFNIFLQYYPKSKLHIIGPMGRGAERIVSSNVIYYGQLEFDQIREIYCIGDVHIHLCKKDSCPSNIPESLAAGIPVITTNLCGGATEMCSLASCCFVVNEGFQSLEADYIYQESYNKMSMNVKESIVKNMLNMIKNKVRAKLPKELMIEYAAQKYLTMLGKIV